MTRAVTIAVLLLVASGGCKKKSDVAADNFNEVFHELRGFREQMCNCKGPECATAVFDRIEPLVASAERRAPNRTAAQQRDYLREAEKLASCMTTAMTPPPPPPSTPAPIDARAAIDAPPARGKFPEQLAASATVDEVLASTRAWARAEHQQLRIAYLRVAYVGADGTLDPDSGEVSIELGRAPVAADDPKRRTGSPIKQPPEQPKECERFGWAPTVGWSKGHRTTCPEAELPFPRCSVPTIWKRAIAKGAPADAVAVLTLSEGKPRRWNFEIEDKPRGIDLDIYIADDCELAVEKP